MMQLDDETYRLSPRQRHILTHSGTKPSAFRARCALTYEGPLSADQFRQHLARAIEDYEMPRTLMRDVQGFTELRQVVAQALEPRVELISLEEPLQTDALIEAWLTDEGGLDTANGPLLQVTLHSHGDTRHLLLLACPAICADGDSLALLGQELLGLTAPPEDEEEGALPHLDVCEWLHDLLTDEDSAAGRAFWLERVPRDLSARGLAMERPTAADAAFSPAHLRVTLPDFQQGEAWLLALWQVLLWHHRDGESGTLGLALDGRPVEDLQGVLGPLVRTVPLEDAVTQSQSFEQLVQTLAEQCAAIRGHQEYFEWSLFPDLEEIPTLPFVFSWREADPLVAWCHTDVEPYKIQLAARPKGQDLMLVYHYDKTYHDAQHMRVLADQLAKLHRVLLANPQTVPTKASLLDATTRAQILSELQGPMGDHPPAACFFSLFEAAAMSAPNAEALVFENGDGLKGSWSYGELRDQVLCLAAVLAAHGARPEQPVGLCLDRSPEMVVGMLAILATGAAYLPMDPGFPAERLAFTARDANLKLVITDADGATRFPEQTVIDPKATTDVSFNPPTALPNQMAYIIYTSGSTGRPKGVVNTHRAALNHMHWIIGRFAIGSEDRLLQRAPVIFDASVWEVWVPLMAGARLVLARPGAQGDPDYLVRTLRDEGITIFQCVPSLLGPLVQHEGFEACRPRLIFTAGEVLPVPLARQLAAREDSTLINMYGPTEASIDVSYWVCRQELPCRNVPIGKPLDHTDLYVLDEHMEARPIGLAGRLYLGGRGLARGYGGRPALTATRFLPHPFSQTPGARLYDSGDQARLLPDGNLDFIGRADHQVKLRGFRIELGEIEAALATLPELSQAAVIIVGERLVAFYAASGPLAVGELRIHLEKTLPDYMIPSGFIHLERLPATPSGKIDRKVLPQLIPEVKETTIDHGERPPTEAILANIWAELLDIPQPARDDNFFNLGGHSLSAIRLVGRVREIFGVELPLDDLFENPTLGALAAQLEKVQAGADLPPLVPVPRDPDGMPMSHAQHQLWAVYDLSTHKNNYNMVFGLKIRGHLNVAALESAWLRLVERHEILRTTFGLHGNRPVQIIGERRDSLTCLEFGESEDDAVIGPVTDTPFDLAKGPLVRALLLRRSLEEHLLVMAQHHIISDGWSVGVMVRELSELYAARVRDEADRLAPLPLQYADYAVWQHKLLDQERVTHLTSYWREQLDGMSWVQKIPGKRPVPVASGAAAGHLYFDVDDVTSTALKQHARAEGATLYMVLLSGLKLALTLLTGERDQVVGSDAAGRKSAATEGLIGFFVNMLVMRTDLSGEPTFRELLRRVRTTALAAYKHGDLPFDSLVEALDPAREGVLNPLFQILFSWQNAGGAELKLPGLVLEPKLVGQTAAKLELTVAMFENGDALGGDIQFAPSHVEEAGMALLRDAFLLVLSQAAEDPDTPMQVFAERVTALESEARAAKKEARKSRMDKFKKVRRRG